MDHTQQIVGSLESLIDLVVPDADHPLCRVYVAGDEVVLWVGNGRYVLDPSGRLRPGRGGSASVALRRPADIDPELFVDWMCQAVAIEGIAA